MIKELVENIDKLNANDALELEKLLEEYPYCQSLQLLYAVALANMHSTRLKEQVHRAAVSMPDRLKLCQMVSNGEFEWITLMNEIEAKKFEEKQKEEEADDFLIVDRYLDNLGETTPDSLPYNIENVTINDYELDDEDFGEEMKSLSDEQDDLINSFIEAEKNGELFVPKVQELLNTEDEDDNDISLKKIREKAFLSESLAKIYVKQHKYEQAIAIFSALNLRYSKKYTYFADQIRYLETILSYQNGETNKQENK